MRVGFIGNTEMVHDVKWARELSRQPGIGLFFYTVEGSRIPPMFEESTIPVEHAIPRAFPFRKFYRFPGYKGRLRKAIGAHQVEVVVSSFAYPNALWGALTNKPQVIITHGSDVLVFMKQIFEGSGLQNAYFRKRLTRAFLEAKAVVSTSAAQQEYLTQWIPSLNRGKMYKTFVGLDDAWFETPKDPEQGGRENKIIFSPRLMKPVYNIELIVDALVELRDRGRDVSLLQIDQAPESDYSRSIRERARERAVADRITYLPFMDQGELIKTYDRSDVVVMVPHSDGTPVSGFEAMARGVPLVLGTARYDPDYFSNGWNWILEKNEAGGLADVLEGILFKEGEAAARKCAKAQEVGRAFGTVSRAIGVLNDTIQAAHG